MSGTSTLDPDNFPVRSDRGLGKGHGTGALGPSDSSDSGSDVHGGAGFSDHIDPEQLLDLDTGTNADREGDRGGSTAGPDVGDADFSSDSDGSGTGERASAGRDSMNRDGADIDTDRIESGGDPALTEEDTAFLDTLPPGQKGRRI